MEGRRIHSAVVTGATGMIGAALVRRMIKDGIRVTALVQPGSRKLGNLPKSTLVTVVNAGIADWKALDMSDNLRGADAFFHLAWMGTYGDARNDFDLQLANISGTLEAVRLAERLGCFVFVGAGSQAEYKKTSGILGPDSLTEPETGYGAAKLAAGLMSRRLCRQYGIAHLWTRFFSVYGPCDNDYTMVMSGIRSMLAGKRQSYTAGDQLWDYLYCDDAAEAMFRAAVYGVDQCVYCVGSGEVRPLAEYIEMMRGAVGPDAQAGLGERPYFPGQVMHLQADISTLKRDTGFSVSVPFEEGIQRTVEWAKEAGPRAEEEGGQV